MQNLMTNPWVWTVILGGLLFYPTRQFLWVMVVRRLERRLGQPVPEADRQSLKRRMTVTAILVCFLFSVAYSHVLIANLYGRP
jgi:hypothetical protein